MFRFFFIFLFVVNLLNANEVLKQKNVIAVKNIIEKEENIAYEFERYLLNELKIPTLNDLLTNDYLGENFNLSSSLGNDISFKDSTNLQLNVSINNPTLENSYLKLLYKRELYRENSSVYWESNYANAYVNINLKSDEAKTIFKILKSGQTIQTTCSNTLVNKYCQSSKLTIRWYNSSSQWIEYNKDSFTNGDVSVSQVEFVDNLDSKLDDLPVGTKIYIQNNGIKLKVEIAGVIKYLDVTL